MSEGKALALVGVGTMLLSAAVDVALLKLHAGGSALAIGMVAVLIPCSFVTDAVMGHYENMKEHREREATLLR